MSAQVLHEIVIKCDGENCGLSIVFHADRSSIKKQFSDCRYTAAIEHGWISDRKKDYCPKCSAKLIGRKG